MINKEELEELYWGEPGTEMGAIIIADKLGCSQSTIYKYLRKYNIPVRPPVTESRECMTKISVETASRKYKELHRTGVLDMSGENAPNYGKKASAETRKKMSEARKEHLNANALKEDRALEIYHLYKDTDISLKGLKDKYKHSKKTIYEIISCKHWATKNLTPISKSPGHKGMSNHKAKIDKKTGLEIYKKYKNEHIAQKELAKKYKVSISTINRIVYCNHWTTEDLKPISKSNNQKGIFHPKAKIDKKTGLKIYNKYKNGNLTRKDLADNYGVSISTISRIINCKHWTTEHLSDD